jgi:hypothetical protein
MQDPNTSAARTAANIANSQLSTGPKSEEGKARVSQNARKHGLTSRVCAVTDAERPDFDQLSADLRAQLGPDGVLEEICFRQALHAAWNLDRVSRLEADFFLDPAEQLISPDYARLLRYRTTHQRSFYRATAELRKLQTERALRASSPEAAEIPPMAAVTVLHHAAKQSQSPSSSSPGETGLQPATSFSPGEEAASTTSS